jgi:hypothetical protein
MTNRIYFIGGASASGKSEVTKYIKENFENIKTEELDDIYNSFDYNIVESEKVILTQELAYRKIGELYNLGFSGIVEGGWISPSKANELKNTFGNRFYPVYCGYPNANVEDRIEEIIQSKEHWLKSKTPDYRFEWVTKQKIESEDYQYHCNQYKIPFFDFSDFKIGSKNLFENYKEWSLL